MLDFLGIGAQKAGTTWIADNMQQHPQVAFPGNKEVHFWDWHYDRGVDWYRKLFEANNKIQGDISPSYAFLPVERIREVHVFQPEVRLIYSVRDPIDRAWSSARMMLRRSEMKMEEASDQWFIDLFNSQGSRDRGNYVMAVDNWLLVFPEEQLLVVKFEDIITRPVALLQDIATHIGVDGAYFTERTVNCDKIHAGVEAPIRESLLPVLHALYDDQIVAMKQHPVLGKLYE